MRTFVQQAPWEFERHRRGTIRWYPFDNALGIGLNSAGSSATVVVPMVTLASGALSATPQSKGREMVERNSGTNDLWEGYDLLNYWGRPHRLSIYMGIGSGQASPSGSTTLYALFMKNPGNPPWNLNGANAVVALYADIGNGTDGFNPRWFLWTSQGGFAGGHTTQLTGVNPPWHPATGLGAAKTTRMEIVYDPGQKVTALIDGVVGAETTTDLPNTANPPAIGTTLAGCGAYINQGAINDQSRADFSSLMIETYRP